MDRLGEIYCTIISIFERMKRVNNKEQEQEQVYLLITN